MKRFIALALMASSVLTAPALAQAPVAVCDPNNVSHCLAPTSSGALSDSVTGNVAAGTTDSGNGVKISGVYNSTPPTYTTGQRGDLQITPKGALATTQQDALGISVTYQNSSSDAVANTSYGVPAPAFSKVYNGTNWDRLYSASAVNGGTSAVGIPSSGLIGFDGTNYRWVKTDSSGNIVPTPNAAVNLNLIGSAAVPTFGADGVSNSQSGLYTYGRNSVFNGTTWDLQRSGAAAAAAGGGIGSQSVEEAGRTYANITTATTTTVKSGKGNLRAITVNTGVASATITVYDNTTASAPKVATITLPSTVGAPFSIPFDLAFVTGLTIVTSGATDITVIYR